jgi:hypothetical protein
MTLPAREAHAVAALQLHYKTLAPPAGEVHAVAPL